MGKVSLQKLVWQPENYSKFQFYLPRVLETSKKEIVGKNDFFDSDCLIIGGGITGACIFWDARLRGLSCTLVEKNDFASGTSQATSKLIHGGLRYLKNFELGLVRESLRERRILGKISPHGVRSLGFALPIYSQSESLMLRAGMELYDKLSYDRNQGISSDLWIPKYSFWNRSRAIQELPLVPREGLVGAYLYYDYANINPERHTTEFILSAVEKGGTAYHYTEVIGLEKIISGAEPGYRVILKDKITGKNREIKTRTVVNATGPWADILEDRLGIPGEKHLVRSKGIHIVIRRITKENCVVLKKRDKSHLFVIPWRGKTIVGTTDSVYSDSPDAFRVTKEDIQNLIDDLNYAYGNTSIKISDVDFYYGGLRPLVDDSGGSSSYSSSRKAEVMDYKDHGFPGVFAALGGKYTTSRAVAESLVDKLADYLPGEFGTCQTADTPLLGGDYADQHSLCKDLEKKFPKESGEKIEILASRYGTAASRVLKSGWKEKGTYYTLSGGEKFYPEEVLYLAKNEMIEKASDFYFRRSGVGVLGKGNSTEWKAIFDLLAKAKNWKPVRKNQEWKEITERYEIS